ncbi:hypothetical protein HK101_000893 [Irineochytrium annulatum]|nr:hypothetical protein HK101_000893 [Irineochytrium annulatum]
MMTTPVEGEPQRSQRLPTSSMSRLMVKNLPKHLTSQRLREHFSAKGEVTDCKIAKTKEGESRRFGFIGFKTEKEAKAALRYYNSTYIDTSKIEVSLAKPINDPSLPRPWSRHSEGSSAFDRRLDEDKLAEKRRLEREERVKAQREATLMERERKEKLVSALYADEADSKLKEFLDVMRPRTSARAKTWANDDGLRADGSGTVKGAKARGITAQVQTVANRKTGGEGMLLTKMHVKFVGEDDEEEGDEYQDLPLAPEAGAEKMGEEKDAAKDSVATDAALSDLEYMKARMKRGLVEDVDEEMANAEIEEEKEEKGEEPESAREQSDSGGEPSRAAKLAKEFKTMFADSAPNAWDPSKLDQDVPDRAKLKDDDPPPLDLIADTGRLYVRNLPFTCTPEDLQKLFGKFGPLAEVKFLRLRSNLNDLPQVHISIDKESKKSRGFAFVMFLIPEHAVKAYSTLDNQFFQGRILEILPGKEKPMVEEEETGDSPFKRKRDAKRKAEAMKEYSWNSLFINSDAVADAMAMKLNVAKSDILDPTSENLAVRLALAETTIIAETKAYLEEEGVNLDAFERRKARSQTIILVKNIPAGTEPEEISEIFARFGTLGRVVVPPSGTIAMVEFLEPNEAKSAFKKLAYTKFKHLPMFLEMAPVDSFKAAFDAKEVEERRKSKKAAEMEVVDEPGAFGAVDLAQNDDPKPPVKDAADIDSRIASVRQKASKKLEPVGKEVEKDELADPDAMPVATLFVKNLNFSTTEDGLQAAFSSLDGLRSVRISTKPDKKGGKLSMGFGFVEFDSKDHAVQAMKAMQGFTLDKHQLQLKFSNAAMKTITSSRKREEEDVKVKGTKLVVRNIPFEATKKDIQKLYSSFGQVKSVRLPKKADGTHRGFCFVDFLTKQEAVAAFKSLGSTHLYGRHLVMEWAEDDADVEAMRAKTAKSFYKGDEGLQASKRRKVQLGAEDVVES